MRPVDCLHELQQQEQSLVADRRQHADLLVAYRDRSALVSAQQRLSEAEGALRRLEGDQRDQELAAESQRTKIREIDAKLYGGKVSSPRELGNLSAEAQMFRTQLSGREDRLLDLYDRLEAAQADLSRCRSALQEAEASHRVRQDTLRRDGRELEARITAVEEQRVRTRARLNAEAQALYDRLTSSRGTAVAELRQRTCQACRIALPLGIEARARGEDLIPCPNCGRVLWLRQ